MSAKKPRVLVIDDSARSRLALAEALTERGCEVVGRAVDGRLGLRMVLDLEPDVVSCDLEMPRMDGFSFLRIVTHQRPLPVIMVTSDARPESAIRALELGARDFVVKPGIRGEDVARLGDALAARIFALAAERTREPFFDEHLDVKPPENVELVAIGASTGGPRALRDLLSRLGGPPEVPIVIAQHMPPRFTTAFAGRLARVTGFDVAEARHEEVLKPGMVRVAPGGNNVVVVKEADELRLQLSPPPEDSRHVPSVDLLLSSAAKALGAGVLGLVLTGMGRDGERGAQALARVGAHLWTESSATAVIDGMPQAAEDGHPGAVPLHLDVLASLLAAVVHPDDGL